MARAVARSTAVRRARCSLLYRLPGLALSVVALAVGAAGAVGASGAAGAPEPDPLSEIVVKAPEPLFVAPTLRDKIGRIWAPVIINGRGPFRLVLDTGATHSAVDAWVAATLGLSPDASQPVLLHGVTGTATVPTIRVRSFAVGDVILTSATLPIVADALGGADGVLGTDGLQEKRIYIDFEHDRITIAHSRGERTPANFVSLPLERTPTGLLLISALVAGVHVHAIIDTGGQATIGNEAMRNALVRRRATGMATPVTDVTTTTEAGASFASPPIELGSIQIRGVRVTYGAMQIFEHWHLTHEPVLLIGMDVIGLLDVFIIDYRRRELELRMRAGWAREPSPPPRAFRHP
jgi:predicted aspartyl protease